MAAILSRPQCVNSVKPGDVTDICEILTTRAMIQYKDIVLPVQEIPL